MNKPPVFQYYFLPSSLQYQLALIEMYAQLMPESSNSLNVPSHLLNSS